MNEYSHTIQFQGYLDPNPLNKAQNNPISNKQEKHNALTKPRQNLVLNSSPMSPFHLPPKKIEHHDINSSASLLQIHSLFPFRQLRLVSDPTYPYKNDQQETCPSKNDLQERVSLFC